MVESHKIGICRVSANGKPCRTVFTRIHFNGKSSVVKCKSFLPLMKRFHFNELDIATAVQSL